MVVVGAYMLFGYIAAAGLGVVLVAGVERLAGGV